MTSCPPSSGMSGKEWCCRPRLLQINNNYLFNKFLIGAQKIAKNQWNLSDPRGKTPILACFSFLRPPFQQKSQILQNFPLEPKFMQNFLSRASNLAKIQFFKGTSHDSIFQISIFSTLAHIFAYPETPPMHLLTYQRSPAEKTQLVQGSHIFAVWINFSPGIN